MTWLDGGSGRLFRLRARGFTLVELMIVIAMIAILTAVAIPNMMAARLQANETAAIAHLRSISTAQAQFQTSAKADVDNDGSGEFGFFRELASATPVRTAADGTASGGSVLWPTALSQSFGVLNSDGEVVRSGYHYRVFLPNANGDAIGELTLTTLEVSAAPGLIDTPMAESIWCAYAWPATGGSSGWRTFFINQRGDVTGSEQDGSVRSGRNGIEAREAGYAFTAPGSARNIAGRNIAYGVLGRDGNLWKQIN